MTELITDVDQIRARWAALREQKAQELETVVEEAERTRAPRPYVPSGNRHRSVRSTPQSRANNAEAARRVAAERADRSTCSPLKRARLDAGLTQAACARRAGVSVKTWARAEQGNANLSTDVRRDIARVFPEAI